MNKVHKIFTLILLIFFIFLLFKFNYLLKPSVLNSLDLWLNKVFPSLFIMFIINDILINTNILNDLNKLINPLFNKIFHTTGNAFSLFLLSIFSGSPTNAHLIKTSLEKGEITYNTAQKLMNYTYFSNPLFLYNILSMHFNSFITSKIIIIHYLSNIIIALLVRGKESKEITITYQRKKTNIFLLLSQSISKSINTLLMILGCLSFYMIISNLLITLLPFNNTFIVISKGLLEITQGLNILNIIPYQSIIKEMIAIFLISFGGLSIHTQVLSLINDNKLYKEYLKGRIYQALISTVTYIIIYVIFLYI